MLISEVIQRIQSLYSKGVQSDDSRLTSRHIYNVLSSIRVKLLTQKANKKQKINQWNYQTIPCVELILAPVNECPCLPPIGCSILKSKHPLPKPLTGLNSHMIESVTSIDGSIVYSETSWLGKKYKKGNKYTASKPDYYIRNEYLYITHKGGPKIISITGIFEDPIKAVAYESFCEEDCTGPDCVGCQSPLDQEFPLDDNLVHTAITLAKEELIGQFMRSKEDVTNNTIDTDISESK